jgi:hypothetical protein
MTNASKWTNGITLRLSQADQDYIDVVLRDLGIEEDYPVEKKSVGLIKVDFASPETDEVLLGYKDKVAPILNGLLPLRMPSDEIKVIVPWNTQLAEIVWFEMDLQDTELREKIDRVREELAEALDPVTHETNRERNKDFKPHVTLIYKLTPEVKERVLAKMGDVEGNSLEEKMNAFLKEKGHLPHAFTFEQAEFYLEGDGRVAIA